MIKLYIIMMLVFIINGTPGQGGGVNPETGIMELLSGEIRLNEIYSAAGIIVGADCTLIVDGDVDAGAIFICRGGRVNITGKLSAEVIYFDSRDAALLVEAGEISAKYYTQCGGTVKIGDSIILRVKNGDDGRGLANINSVYSENGASILTVGGGIIARGGDIWVGALPPGDEASTASFFGVRGVNIIGYDFPSSGNRTYIYTRKGLAVTGGGTVYRDYSW